MQTENCPQCDGNGYEQRYPLQDRPPCIVCQGAGQLDARWAERFGERRTVRLGAMMWWCDVCGEYRVVVTLDGKDVCAGCAGEMVERQRVAAYIGAPA